MNKSLRSNFFYPLFNTNISFVLFFRYFFKRNFLSLLLFAKINLTGSSVQFLSISGKKPTIFTAVFIILLIYRIFNYSRSYLEFKNRDDRITSVKIAGKVPQFTGDISPDSAYKRKVYVTRLMLQPFHQQIRQEQKRNQFSRIHACFFYYFEYLFQNSLKCIDRGALFESRSYLEFKNRDDRITSVKIAGSLSMSLIPDNTLFNFNLLFVRNLLPLKQFLNKLLTVLLLYINFTLISVFVPDVFVDGMAGA